MCRSCCGYYQLAVWFTIYAVLFTVYMKYPAPPHSTRLKEWQNDGGIWFKYGEFEYFVKDSSIQHPPINKHILVLLHGFPSFSMDWHKVFERLSARFDRIIAPDFLGLGFSDKPLEHVYSIEEQADMIEIFLASRHLQDVGVHIMAHDYGDTVAQELLFRFNTRRKNKIHGQTYRSFCLLNGGIIQETHYPRWGQKLLLLPYVGQVVADYFTNYMLFKRGFVEIFSEKTPPMEDELQDYWAALRHNEGYSVLPGLLRYIEQRRTNGTRWVAALQEANIPGLVIYGADDPVNPPEFVNAFQERVPNVPVSVLAPSTGHYPQLEDPMHLINIYFRFLHRFAGIDFDLPPLKRPEPIDARAERQARVPYPR